MEQLVRPNLTVVGKPYLCEKYTENVFGMDGKLLYALRGWETSKFQHGGNPPQNVAVPIFYNWTGTVDGERKNYGHAAVWAFGTIYTNPLSGTGHKTFTSISALQSSYGLGSYLGWTEDLANVRIVKEANMLTPGQQDKLIKMAKGSEPTEVELNDTNWANNPGLAIDTLWEFYGKQNYPRKQPEVNKQTVQDYIANHLS